jgi:hypothetical protein
MYTRLKDIPVFEFRETQLDAGHFNHVQVALKKLGDTIRFPIPKLKHLDLILEKEAWIIVDHVLNDIPVAAWTEFQTDHRDNLHQPIKCRLQLYHANADLILARTLEAMEMLLGERLAAFNNSTSDDTANVLPFRDQ